MKKILLIVFVLSIVTETYAQLVESRTMLTSYDIVQPKKRENKKKKEWKFRLGLSASTLTGDDIDSDFELGNHTGYQLGFEYRRFGRRGLFYGMEFNFASRGYTVDDVTITKDNGGYYNRYGYWIPDYTTYTDDAKLTCHEFEWVPVNFGYRYDINKDIAVSTRIGLFVNAIITGTYTVGDYEEDYYDYMHDTTPVNVGFKWGIGTQWKKLAVDFEIQKSFIDHAEDFSASERAINFTVGYIF